MLETAGLDIATTDPGLVRQPPESAAAHPTRSRRARLAAALARAQRGLKAAAAGPEALMVRLRYGDPDLTLAFWGGIGDELLMTGVTHELRRRGVERAWVFSTRPELWRGNTDPALVVDWDERYFRWVQLFGWSLFLPHYTTNRPAEDRDVPPPRHILTIMCELVGIVGPIARRTYLHLTDAERARGVLAPNQVVIQSAGLTARHPMRTKQWFPERYQAVVDARRAEFTFLQIGSPSDPPLDGAIDLRGRTTLRETAALLANALAFVGQVGMPMHLARAVDCPSVIVYGGREHPDQTGYSCNENLYAPVPCSPCWQLNTCDYGLRCMDAIGPSDVVRALDRQVARRHEPLAVDTDSIALSRVPSRETADGRTLLTVPYPNGTARDIRAWLPLRDGGA